MSQTLQQVGGSHYQNMKLPHVTFCETNRIGWCASCVLKYVLRFESKNKFQDLEKAHHYLLLMAEHYLTPEVLNRPSAAAKQAREWKNRHFAPESLAWVIEDLEPCLFTSENDIEGDRAAAMDHIVLADACVRAYPDLMGSRIDLFLCSMQNAQLALTDLMAQHYPEEAALFFSQKWGVGSTRMDRFEPDDPVPEEADSADFTRSP
jgi:hypothetical protein